MAFSLGGGGYALRGSFMTGLQDADYLARYQNQNIIDQYQIPSQLAGYNADLLENERRRVQQGSGLLEDIKSSRTEAPTTVSAQSDQQLAQGSQAGNVQANGMVASATQQQQAYAPLGMMLGMQPPAAPVVDQSQLGQRFNEYINQYGDPKQAMNLALYGTVGGAY